MISDWCETAGRRVKICTGRVSQSINICFTENPTAGNYEYRLKTWDASHFLTPYEIVIQAFENVCELLDYLRSMGYQDVGEASRPVWEPLAPDCDWGESHREAIERVIGQLTDEFMAAPYRHRVEHSLHCTLFGLLDGISSIGNEHISIAGGFTTGLVHKEWPETLVRDQRAGRGNFDLAVLTPRGEQDVVERQRFIGGHIRPFAAFELGLDYDRNHFLNDVFKLRHSRIDAGYVIHFARCNACDQDHVIGCLEDLYGDGREGNNGWPNVTAAIQIDRGWYLKRVRERPARII